MDFKPAFLSLRLKKKKHALLNQKAKVHTPPERISSQKYVVLNCGKTKYTPYIANEFARGDKNSCEW